MSLLERWENQVLPEGDTPCFWSSRARLLVVCNMPVLLCKGRGLEPGLRFQTLWQTMISSPSRIAAVADAAIMASMAPYIRIMTPAKPSLHKSEQNPDSQTKVLHSTPSLKYFKDKSTAVQSWLRLELPRSRDEKAELERNTSCKRGANNLLPRLVFKLKKSKHSVCTRHQHTRHCMLP